MKNKTIILTAENENNIEDKQREKYFQYAKENGLELTEEIHYPFAMPFADPEIFVKEVMKAKPDIILTDDEVFLYANLYHDGKIIEMFEEKGVNVINTEIEMELSKLNDQFTDEFKARFKNAVHYAFAMTFSQEITECLGKNVAIICNSEQKDEADMVAGYLKSSGVESISCFIADEINDNVTAIMDQKIREKNINSIIVYEGKQTNDTLKNYLSALDSNRNVNVYYSRQNQNEQEMSQIMKMN